MNQDAKVEEWMSIRRWSMTSNGNYRRIVETPGHAFVICAGADDVLALYREDDGEWVKVARTSTVHDAKIALLACAENASVDWR